MATDDITIRVPESLARELALYRRLAVLADESLSLLAAGDTDAALLPILEEKRGILREVRELQERARGDRERWHRSRHQLADGALADLDRVTEEMESVLRETIRKEEEVDLKLRAMGFAHGGVNPRAHAAWFRPADSALAAGAGGPELVRVG